MHCSSHFVGFEHFSQMSHSSRTHLVQGQIQIGKCLKTQERRECRGIEADVDQRTWFTCIA